MKKKTPKTSRREFLQGSVQALLAAPAAMASMRDPNPKGETLLEESSEPLPGEPGYRGPVDYPVDYNNVDE